jgi:hypothetical protein
MANCEYFWSRGCDPEDDRSADEIAADNPGAQFMCLKTMTQVGPDDRLAEPDICDGDRECFANSGA